MTNNFVITFKLFMSLLLTITILCVSDLSFAQSLMRARLQQRFIKDSQNKQNQSNESNYKKTRIAGLDIAIWEPRNCKTPAPLVIFSHGFGGCNTQSKFIMQAMADAGYLIMAPNHKDSFVSSTKSGDIRSERPETGFRNAREWSDCNYIDRHDDIVRLINALKKDSKWKERIDWSKVALCGHSLGGYTVLGLGGAWPSWKQTGIKAILVLSPYCEPFVLNGNLANIGIPVMYQGGTRDLGITPTIKNLHGALSKTSSPAYFIEFNKLGHFGWTNFNKNQEQKDLINYYCLAFLDKYVKGNVLANPDKKLAGVSDIRIK